MVKKRDKEKENNKLQHQSTRHKNNKDDTKLFTDKERKAHTVAKQMRGGFE